MSAENETPTPKTDRDDQKPLLPKGLKEGAEGLWYRLRESVIPEVHYLTGETEKLTIRMAPYRKQIPTYMIAGGFICALISLGFYLTARNLEWSSTSQLVTGTLVLLFLYIITRGSEEWLVYEQWQFILTDKRIILVTPDPTRKGFADAIYLKQGKIQVLDTNWSKNPIWGLFQATKGTRDVMLSMSGYEFKEEGAQVKGGLRFPDVLPEDIKKLEDLIFG